MWVGLGAGHTAFSFARKGFPPNRPPAVGIVLPPDIDDLLSLHELLQQTKPQNVVLLLPSVADTGLVVFLRYQLAYINYPVRVFARRSDGPAQLAASENAVIVPASISMPPIWRPVAHQDSFTLFMRMRP